MLCASFNLLSLFVGLVHAFENLMHDWFYVTDLLYIWKKNLKHRHVSRKNTKRLDISDTLRSTTAALNVSSSFLGQLIM